MIFNEQENKPYNGTDQVISLCDLSGGIVLVRFSIGVRPLPGLQNFFFGRGRDRNRCRDCFCHDNIRRKFNHYGIGNSYWKDFQNR